MGLGTANACSGMLISEGSVGGLRKHPFGRVDQLEDRYLGMVEAPSSNLGTSTTFDDSRPSSSFGRKARILADVDEVEQC